MSLLFTPVGLSLYLLLALLVARAARHTRLGFWGFFWASLILTPLVTGFFVVMTQSAPARPARTSTPQAIPASARGAKPTAPSRGRPPR
ncbi:MAG: hypothetical protein EBV77_04645 [Gemmatimonadaceae bacterium]|jgi:hypothetical protein|nr:hypothetical protein [Gemmatimonadaceae bacterium]